MRVSREVGRIEVLARARSLLAAGLLAAPSFAQTFIDWTAGHDGSLGQSDIASCCAVDSVGNVIVAGFVNYGGPPYSTDVAVVEYSSTGVELWSAERDLFGGDDRVSACAVDSNDDVYVAGASANGANFELVLMKFSSAGAFTWMRSMSAARDLYSHFTLDFDALGNVIVCGFSNHAATRLDVLLQSYSPTGVLNWSTDIDGGAGLDDYGMAMRVLPSGEIAVVGSLRSASGRGDFAAWKFDAHGAVVWTRSLDGGSNLFDMAEHIAVSPAGELLAGGFRMEATDNSDWMLVQFDLATGAVDWTDFFDVAPPDGASVSGVGIGAGGDWWVCGFESTLTGSHGILTRRYSSSGAVLSSSSWSVPGGMAIYNLTADGLKVGSAGQAWVFSNLYGAGGASSIGMLEFDGTGALVLEDYIFGSIGSQYGIHDMALAPADRMVLAGRLQANPTGVTDFFTVQLNLSQLPAGYCTAKTTSTGCEPFVTFSGSASASASSGFAVRAGALRNQRSGLLFYGLNGAAAAPFQGGTMCIAAPRMRTPTQSSGGNSFPADDCSGSFALDMNAFANGALGGSPLPALQVAGTTVHCQFWGRDPGFAPPLNTMLSSALRYVVLP